jgi:hypothetical protein
MIPRRTRQPQKKFDEMIALGKKIQSTGIFAGDMLFFTMGFWPYLPQVTRTIDLLALEQ